MKSILVLSILLLTSPFAWSHKSSDSFIHLTVSGEHIMGRWDIALRDLEYALAIDLDGDGAVTWYELRTRYEEIKNYAFKNLLVTRGSTECIPKSGQLQVDHHTDGNYAVLNFDLDCNETVDKLDIKYQLLFDLDPTHRGLLEIKKDQSSEFVIFSPENQNRIIDFSQPSRWQTFCQFVEEGIWHILIGYDHILFLLCLLFPSVVRKTTTGWQASEQFSSTFWHVGKIVTAFTLAHSITLVLAVLQVVSLPSRLIESAIAFSVILVALNNVYPFFSERAWLVAFVFGLIHGFGFATVLTDLELAVGSLSLSLLGFNMGVEIGQLTLVSVFLPVAFLFRRYWFYQRIVLLAGSQAIMVLALVWFLQRAFDLNIISS
ncbi:MAG: HupE/UreJ family protein [Methylococcaceae bacterium]|nr:HupE/UreJ family protein [Methylococcaceae bacterium]